MKIAIFGGAFNPPHKEHVNIVKAAREKFGLDKIIVVPTGISPHKSGKLTASGGDRINMCRLAFSEIEGAEVSAFELDAGGVSYSYKTCRHFKELYPEDELYFLIGADMLRIFPEWRNPEEILSICTLVSCARENGGEFESYKKDVEDKFGVKVETINYVGKKVSSTAIRTLAYLGEDFSGYVTENVCQYIKERGIYYCENVARVKNFLTPERWAHTVRVAKECARGAAEARVTEEQALTMAALHDCAKYLPADSPYLAGFVCPDGVPEPVVHQFAGAYMAGNYFKITDRTVLEAIEYHASGRENMTTAQMLLYLADMLEEGRTFDGVEALRKIFKEQTLDKAMFAALSHQLKYLKSTGKPVYNLTEKAYGWLASTDTPV